MLPFRPASELRRLRAAAHRVDVQAAVVLLVAPALVILHRHLGSRRLFRTAFAEAFAPAWQGVLEWGWWFAWQGVLGFLVPVLVLTVGFRRRHAAIGLGSGDVRLALFLGALYLPVVAVGTWFLSADPAFQAVYPHYGPAAFDWRFFAVYEALFLFYWVGWEYLWRGFVLFGTAPAFGPVAAVLIQAVPFAVLHVEKPLAEGLLSIVGGVALGALVWRCRSFWIAVPLHAAQMLILDLWCTLRLRTGAQGVGLEALRQLLGGG